MTRRRTPRALFGYLFIQVGRALNSAERTESPVHRDHGAVNEAAGGTAQPDQCAHQFLRLAEPPGRGVLDDPFPPRSQGSVLADEKFAILLSDEESRRDGVDSQAGTMPPREFNREPPGKVFHGGFPRRVSR